MKMVHPFNHPILSLTREADVVPELKMLDHFTETHSSSMRTDGN
jgi:hypothetical protein